MSEAEQAGRVAQGAAADRVESAAEVDDAAATRWLLGALRPSLAPLLAQAPLAWAAAALGVATAALVAPILDLALNGGRVLRGEAAPSLASLDSLAAIARPWLDLDRRPLALLLTLGALLLALRLAHGVVTVAARWLGERALAETTARLQRDVHGALLRLPLASPRRRLDGGAAQARLLNEAQLAVAGLDRAVATLAAAPLLVALYGALIASSSALLAAVVLGGLALHAAVGRAIARGVPPRLEAMLDAWAAKSAHAQESLRNARLIRASAGEAPREREFAGLCERHAAAAVRLGAWRALEGPLRDLVEAAVRVAVALAVAHELLSGRVGLVGAGLLLYLGLAIGRPLAALAALAPLVTRARTATRRLREVLAEAEPAPAAGGLAPPAEPTSLRLEQVELAYEAEGAWRLGPLDLELRAGERVVIQGPSGAGKSTLLDLACGLRRQSRGRVLLDEQPLAAYDPLALRGAIGVVAEEAQLFTGTLRENLAFARRGADEEALREAVHAAALEDLVARLPGGLDAPLGEGGAHLSAGERQRVALARALVGRPRILLLDEATSHLDLATAARVRARLAALEPRPAMLVVSHEPEWVEAADAHVLLDRGRRVDPPRALAAPTPLAPAERA